MGEVQARAKAKAGVGSSEKLMYIGWVQKNNNKAVAGATRTEREIDVHGVAK